MNNELTTQIPIDFAKASALNAQIINSAKMAQQNLYDMAIGFKQMRDEKLYLSLGYKTFGDYCESETGIKRTSVYNYITIIEKLPINFVQSTEQIGKEKLLLLSSLDQPQREEIAQTVDLEYTTVKELKAKIEQLKQQNTKLEEDKQKHKETVADLEKQIEELENRPIDVAVTDNTKEVEDMRQAMMIGVRSMTSCRSKI